MLFLALAAAFGLLAIHPKTRSTCTLLCGLNIFLLIVTTFCDRNGDALYWFNTIGSTVVAIAACIHGAKHSYYQAIIQLCILCSYLALAYDVSHGQHVLIYNSYETVIYGLVACQFVGIFTAIRYVDYDHIERCLRRGLHLQRNKRT